MQTSLIIKNNKYIENNLKHKRATVKSTNITSTKQSLKPREHFGLHPTTFNFTFFQAAIEAFVLAVFCILMFLLEET